MLADPAPFLTKASVGSLKHATVLAEGWPSVRSEDACSALEYFLGVLESFRPQGSTNQNDMALCSLRAIATFSTVSVPHPWLSAKLLPALPSIVRCSALEWSAHERSTRPTRLLIRDTIAGALFCVCREHNDAHGPGIRSTPGALELVTRLWTYGSDSDHPHTVFGELSVRPLLLTFFLRQTPAPKFDNIVVAAGGSCDIIAQTAISPLRSLSVTTTTSSSALTRLHCHIGVVGILVHTIDNHDHPLFRALSHKNAISTMTKLLSRLAKCSRERAFCSHMIPGLFGIISHLLALSVDVSETLQALDHGVLGAFIDYSFALSSMSPADKQLYNRLITVILPPCAVRLPIVRAIASALSRITPVQEALVLSSSAKEAWCTFRDFYLERNTLVGPRLRNAEKVAACSNPKCNRVIQKTKLRRCKGCMTTLYCSELCQRTDWTDCFHKQLCTTLKAQTSDGSYKSFEEDGAFLRLMARFDCLKSRSTLMEKASLQYPHIPFDCMAIHLDYSALPIEMAVVPIETFLLTSHAPSSRTHTRLQSAGSEKNVLTPIEVMLWRGGPSTHVATFMVAGLWTDAV